MYTAPDCAAFAVLQAANCQCRGSRGPPFAFSWGFKGDILSRERISPFPRAAPPALLFPLRPVGAKSGISPFGEMKMVTNCNFYAPHLYKANDFRYNISVLQKTKQPSLRFANGRHDESNKEDHSSGALCADAVGPSLRLRGEEAGGREICPERECLQRDRLARPRDEHRHGCRQRFLRTL